MSSARSRREAPVLAVLVAYAGLALFVTYPLCTDPAGTVPGIARGDVWDHLWSMDWTRRALLEDRVRFFFTPDAYYPVGLELFPLNLVNELLSVPLQLLFGLVPAFNLLHLLHLVFAGWAAFVLVRRVTGSAAGAFAGGCVYAFTPCVTASLVNGTTETASSGWIPLFVWLLLRDADAGVRLRTVLPAALALFAGAVSCWYYGAFGIIFAIGFALTARWRDPAVHSGRAIGRTAAVLALAGALIAIPAAILQATLHHPDAAYLLDGGDYIVRALQDASASAAPAAFLRPAPPAPGAFHHTAYVGLSAVALAAIGLLPLQGAARRRLWWAGVTLFFAGMALGPALWSGGRPRFFLPYYLAMEYAPFFHALEFPYRFAVMVALGLAVLAGFGVRTLVHGLPAGGRAAAAAACGLLAVVDLAAGTGWPLTVTGASIPGVYARLAQRPEPGAVLELPLGFDFKSRTFYHQLAHRRPIPSGINTVVPLEVEQALLPEPPRRIDIWTIPSLGPARRDALRRMGFAFLVWRPHDDPDHVALLNDFEDAELPLVDAEDGIRVYALGAPPGAP